MVVLVLIFWLPIVLALGLVWIKACHALKYQDKKIIIATKFLWLTIEEDTCSAQDIEYKKILRVILIRE